MNFASLVALPFSVLKRKKSNIFNNIDCERSGRITHAWYPLQPPVTGYCPSAPTKLNSESAYPQKNQFS